MPTRLVFSRQTNDTFDVSGARKEIHRRHGADLVAEVAQDRAIAGEGIGAAGNVHDARHLARGEEAKECLVTALARGIENDNIGMERAALRLHGRQQPLGIGGVTAIKVRVFHPVEGLIDVGALDGIGDDFNTDQLLGALRHRKSDAAGTAIKVKQKSLAVKTRLLGGDAVKQLRRIVVDLIEGGGHDAQSLAAQHVLNVCVPV